MRCAKCGTESRTGRKFCADCGSALAIRCPKCSAENESLSKFCEDCGASLATNVAGPPSEDASPRRAEIHLTERLNDSADIVSDGERKTVTSLFADIKGSMELMEDLDPEEARAIVDPALKLMIDAVHRYGGSCDQKASASDFALFAAAAVHADHHLPRVYAALVMHEHT